MLFESEQLYIAGEWEIFQRLLQLQDDSSQEDGMSKAEVLKVLQAHMDDIKVIGQSADVPIFDQYL